MALFNGSWSGIATRVQAQSVPRLVDIIMLRREYQLPGVSVEDETGEVFLCPPGAARIVSPARPARIEVIASGLDEDSSKQDISSFAENRSILELRLEPAGVPPAPFVVSTETSASYWRRSVVVRLLCDRLIGLPDCVAALRRARYLEMHTLMYELMQRTEVSDGYEHQLRSTSIKSGHWIIVDIENADVRCSAAIQIERLHADRFAEAIIHAPGDLGHVIRDHARLARRVHIFEDGAEECVEAEICEVIAHRA